MFDNGIHFLNYLVTTNIIQITFWKICSSIGWKLGFEFFWCITKKSILGLFKLLLAVSWFLVKYVFTQTKNCFNCLKKSRSKIHYEIDKRKFLCFKRHRKNKFFSLSR